MTVRGRAPRYAPRIVALGMQGYTAQAIAQRVGCGEGYAAYVLNVWRAQGGEPIRQQPRKVYRRIFP